MLALVPKAPRKCKNIEIWPFKLSIFEPRPYIQSKKKFWLFSRRPVLKVHWIKPMCTRIFLAQSDLENCLKTCLFTSHLGLYYMIGCIGVMSQILLATKCFIVFCHSKYKIINFFQNFQFLAYSRPKNWEMFEKSTFRPLWSIRNLQ